MNEESITQEKAEKLLDEWKMRLGLQDWVTCLCPCCKKEEMAMPDSRGCSIFHETTKVAKIQILDPQDDWQDCISPFDWEKTLVHELLHLKTSFISSECDSLQERIAHQLIDDLARAFVDAKRN
jgi:hypothetical protein